jgi:hypothetical protein
MKGVQQMQSARFRSAFLLGCLGAAVLAGRAGGVESCRSGQEHQRVAIDVTASEAQPVISLVAMLSYDPTLLSLPATGADPVMRKRLVGSDGNTMLASNNDGKVLRLVAAKAGGLKIGTLADIDFDRCAGARAPTASDLKCSIESCAGSGGPISGCSCSVSIR